MGVRHESTGPWLSHPRLSGFCTSSDLSLDPQTHIPKVLGLVLLPVHVPQTSLPQLVPNGACSLPLNLLFLSPPRHWGAILPFSFISHQRNHLSCLVSLLNHPQSLLFSPPPEPRSLSKSPALPHRPPLGSQACSLQMPPGRECLGGPVGEWAVVGSFHLPSWWPTWPLGPLLPHLPASGLAASSSLHANHLCLGPCGLACHRQARETHWSWSGG